MPIPSLVINHDNTAALCMVVTFIAIVVPQLARLPNLGAAIAAGICAYLLKDFPYKIGLLLAVFIGVGVGVGLSLARRQSRSRILSGAA